MDIRDLINNSNNITVAIGVADLKEFVLETIQQTKKEMEDLVIAQKSEMYISTNRACEILDVDASTLWRWGKRNYLVAVNVGGKKRYKMADINRLLGKDIKSAG